MSDLTEKYNQAIGQSYTVMALLDICGMASDQLSIDVPFESIPRLSANLGICIRHALELVEQVHDALELAQRQSEAT